MSHKPANRVQDLQNFGEFGGVNPSIADSSTFTYLKASTMQAVCKRYNYNYCKRRFR
jgi:hypothetical protein